MTRRTQLYWGTTALFGLIVGYGGGSMVVRAEWIADTIGRLGYPAYLMTIIGVAKLLGIAVLLAPGRPLLKEWAYAGFAFDLLGATASHAFSGDPVAESARPLFVLALCAASYLLRPADRRLSPAPTLGAAEA